MIESKIQIELKIWLEKLFKDSDLLIQDEVKVQLGEQLSNIRTDLVIIQSKSNVLHAYEIKNKLKPESFNSAFWQTNSMYGNYKWLVTNEKSSQYIQLEKLKDKGIGLILFNESLGKLEFKTKLKAKYIDGNMLNYYPELKKEWNKKEKHGSHPSPKKKN
ncbi:MAG: hypothetical protein L3J66_09310 [Bacteroidales bacterium]|nr:hypothetical protein [Bacteroidales bacterium]